MARWQTPNASTAVLQPSNILIVKERGFVQTKVYSSLASFKEPGGLLVPPAVSMVPQGPVLALIRLVKTVHGVTLLEAKRIICARFSLSCEDDC